MTMKLQKTIENGKHKVYNTHKKLKSKTSINIHILFMYQREELKLEVKWQGKKPRCALTDMAQ